MTLLGLLAATFLGLMALRGLAILFDPASPRPFLLPLPVALTVALAFGLAVTYVLGRSLGLYGLRTLRDYESGRRARQEVRTRDAERPSVPEPEIEY